jgi:hypothetical protein
MKNTGAAIGDLEGRMRLDARFSSMNALSYFEIVFSVLTGFSVNLSANLEAVEIIWE